ncbi:MAG: class I SAM-dependent methyltransferase [Actinobacteria bacterium]|nr:MAG: class I SAM-dependent methyltransferase [Actinomycetota bacterium]
MNEIHLQQCASAEWAQVFEDIILPWALTEMELTDDVLEVGPGPGVTTDGLRRHVGRLTAVEADEELASALAARLAGTNVEVLHADATDLPFDDDRFTAAACFTMLHHVPSPELQDRLLAEVARVLRPGGVLVGIDSADTPEWRELHVGDVCVPVDPATLGERLARAGFADSQINTNEFGFRFSARVPQG